MEFILLKPILNLIGTAILGAISIILVLLNKKLTSWFLEKIWAKISPKYKHSKFKKDSIEKDKKIREILIELRTISGADRACLFQFHNGSSFTTRNPIWKVSNTHESVAPGISSEIGNLQDIKASSIIETLRVFWDSDYPNGIEQISPDYCGDCPNIVKHNEKKIIFIDVEKLEDSYSRALLIEQGIKYLIDVPIFNGDVNCVGFVAVNYCGEHDIEDVKNHAREICKNASQIQFILLS